MVEGPLPPGPDLLGRAHNFVASRKFFLLCEFALLYHSSSVFATCSMEYARKSAVQRVLDRHAPLLQKVCQSLKDEFGEVWLSRQVPVPAAKAAKHSIPARDTTIVDSSLDMLDAMREMLGLSFPLLPGRIDPVLDGVVSEVASLRERVVGRRAAARSFLRAASREISPLTRDLQALVSDFARPINGHVNFGLIECMVRVCEWPTRNLVDLLIFGFQALGEVPWTGANRPVSEPATANFSWESNVKSFDDAVSHLEQRARAAASDEAAMRDFETIWDLAMGECERDLCVGPKRRAEVERMFKDTPFGPRCIPSFAVWQKGKCRRIGTRKENTVLLL